MNFKTPNTPFSTRLSGSAKETELRLRSIFQWKKKRPPVVMILLTAIVMLLCFGLVSCEPAVPQELTASLLVDPDMLEIIDVESQMISGKEEAPSDLWIYEPSTDPLETVRSVIEGQGEKDYTNAVQVRSLSEDETETRRMRQRWIGSELAQSLGWSDELLKEHFTAVLAHYYVEYDHTKTFLDDGNIKQYFYLIGDPETGLWSVADNTGGSPYEPENIPSATQIKEMKAERYAAAIGPYDTNGDGVLQTLEFPNPDPELFGLTGTDAALFSAVSDYIRQTLFIDPEDTMLLLSSVTVYGQYDGENGATHYVCGLWRGMDYDAGIHLAEGGAKFGSNWGGGGYLARVTLSADGSLLEVLPTLEGENNTARIYEICGPLTELVEEALRGSEAEGRNLAPRDPSIFTRYLGYYFPSTMAVQENILDLLRHYMEEYSILVLDVDEVTGMVDICLSDYRPEIMAEIKQLVEDNYSRSDYLNFEDYTGAVNLTT